VDTPKALRCNEKTQNPGVKVVLPQINFIGSCVATNVTYGAPHPGWTCGGRASTPITAQRPGDHRPDGWPLWTSPVRPGREHDTTALRTHAEILPALTIWTAEDRPVLGELG
jgi:hypothetical protein